jgi:tRNA nucleotidyltransferase/poly(A) polymerase
MESDTASNIKYITIPDLDDDSTWREISYILGSLNSWNNYPSRLVGGCVRDLYLGYKPKDFDIATTATPEQVAEVFKYNKVIPTGLQHGTVTLVLKHGQYEITTLRVDRECDGRHAKIEYTNSFKEDARRRDFTMNAMSMDISGKIFDYFGGMKDLDNKIIRFVGDPKKRIQEDYLRIMRLFRFASNYYLNYLPQELEIAAEFSPQLVNISAERTTSELLKTLNCFNAPGGTFVSLKDTLRYMHDAGIFDIILPEFSYEFAINEIAKWEKIPFMFYKSLDPIFILAFLLPSSTSADKLALRMKLTTKQRKVLNTIFNLQTLPKTKADALEMVESLISIFGIDQVESNNLAYLLDARLGGDGKSSSLPRIGSGFDQFYIPFQGAHLLQAGVPAGKKLGELLKYLVWSYRNNMWYNVPATFEWISSLQNPTNLTLALTDPIEYRRTIATILARK